MRESFITSVPDESGAFLKAVTIFTSLGLNIVRTSYNKAVDQHMIFLEAEGDEEGISKARVQLKKIGYLTKEEKEEVVLLEFLLPVLGRGDLAPEVREFTLRVTEFAAFVFESREDVVELVLQ